MSTTRTPTAQTRAASGLLTTLLMLLVVGGILLINSIASGSLTLPWHLSTGQWALVVLLIPVVKEMLTYTLHGLTTDDWTPPNVDDLFGLGNSNETAKQSATFMPMTNIPPPQPAADTLDISLLARMVPVAEAGSIRRYITAHYPITHTAPPSP